MDRRQPKHWSVRSRERHWQQLRQRDLACSRARHFGLARNRSGWHRWFDSSALRLLTVVPLLRENPGVATPGFLFLSSRRSTLSWVGFLQSVWFCTKPAHIASTG